MKEPDWPNLTYPPINYQDIIYYAAPKKRPVLDKPEDADPELLETFKKLGIPLQEQKRLAGSSRVCCLCRMGCCEAKQQRLYISSLAQTTQMHAQARHGQRSARSTGNF